MRVNSYVIFGDKQKWAHNFAANIRQHLVLYPGWTLWIHSDTPLKGGYADVISELERRGVVKVTVVPEEGKVYQKRHQCIQMLWRMLPIWENTEYVFCRDLDSILTPRQLQCVRWFIDSGQVAHGINDNDAHTIPFMGGMCGFKSDAFRRAMSASSLEQLIAAAPYTPDEWSRHGFDQVFMTHFLWPVLFDKSVIHRLTGENDRSGRKIVTDSDISDIPQIVRDRGDSFTNYIGAQGTATDHGSFTIREICDFYDEHCPQCAVVREVEEELGWITSRTAGIFTVRNVSLKTDRTTSTPPSQPDSKSSATSDATTDSSTSATTEAATR